MRKSFADECLDLAARFRNVEFEITIRATSDNDIRRLKKFFRESLVLIPELSQRLKLACQELKETSQSLVERLETPWE